MRKTKRVIVVEGMLEPDLTSSAVGKKKLIISEAVNSMLKANSTAKLSTQFLF